ncbi:hypothetical protein Gotur_008024, partial [Gossypium turneri]
MVKPTSSCKRRRTTTGFSEIEMDVACQLMQLCKQYINGDKGSKKTKAKTDESMEDEEEEHLQPRKRRFKSMDFIYSSTKPVIMQDKNVKKMKVMMWSKKTKEKSNPLEMEEKEEEHLQPRRRKFKSIDFIYSSTKPLIIKDQNV